MAKRYFHWDVVDDCVMHETDEHGDTIVEFTREPGPFGPLISEERGGTESYHHYDALGSTTFLTDAAGNVTDTFAYDAWGNQVARTGTTPTPYTWVGRWGYQDDSATTGGYYVRARSYEPTVARWASVDPEIFSEGLNAYKAVFNNPVKRVDPSGLITVTFVKEIQPKCPKQAGKVIWEYKLDDQAPCNGFIVQKVTVKCSVSPCAGPFNDAPEYSYFEAWRVLARRVRSNQFKSQDSATFPVADCQIGDYQQETEIRFYCNSDVGLPDNSKSRSIPGWDPAGKGIVVYPDNDHPCKTTAGGLTSTSGNPDPGFWANNASREEPAERYYFQLWHCCPSKKPCCGDGVQRTLLFYSPPRIIDDVDEPPKI